jgi:hypothetical protein
MRTRCLCIIALVCFAGCNGTPEPDESQLYIRHWEKGPPKPFASLSQVVRRDGHAFWRKSGKPCTGTLVTYLGGGYQLRAYFDGYAPEELYLDYPEHNRHVSEAGEITRDAFRYYTARNAPGHNEYLRLASLGDESDIPMLLVSLRSFRKREDGLMICCQLHCVAALRAITGANPGYSYSEWASWWKSKYGTEVPDWKPLTSPKERVE